MIVTGIADEAGGDIQTQIRAHKELGWDAIELRLVDGDNCAGALSNEKFAEVADQIETAGLQVTSFASAIGNWSRNIRGDFQLDVDELTTAIGRMQRFGTKFIRTMSWVGEGAPEDEWRDEAVRRYRELAKMAADSGIYLAHENCTGWSSENAGNMRWFLDAVDSPHVVFLFDIGNTVSHGSDPWEVYSALKDRISYVHVKDAKKNPEGGRSEAFTYCGDGDARVREILADIIANGYDGVVSIEPHVAAIVHSGAKASPEEMFESYLRYGRKLMDILADIRKA